MTAKEKKLRKQSLYKKVHTLIAELDKQGFKIYHKSTRHGDLIFLGKDLEESQKKTFLKTILSKELCE